MIVNHVSERDFSKSVKDVDVPKELVEKIYQVAGSISRVPCIMTNDEGNKIFIPCGFPLDRNPGEQNFVYKITIERVPDDSNYRDGTRERYE